MSVTPQPIYEDWTWTHPPDTDPFGPIVSGFEVEHALAMCVRRWMPDYLRAMEEQRGIPAGKLRAYRSEVPTSQDANRLPDNKLPAFAMVSRGYTDRPSVSGDGCYSARWRVDMHTVHAAKGNRQARRLAQFYAAGLRAIVTQHRSLDLGALPWGDMPPESDLTILGIDLLAEGYTMRPEDERTMGEGVVTVQVHVADITTRDGGPWPMYEPGEVQDLPTVETYDIVVQPLEQED
jgi:hypothetical protein